MDRRIFLGQSALGTFLLAKPWGNALRAQGLRMEGGRRRRNPFRSPPALGIPFQARLLKSGVYGHLQMFVSELEPG